MLTIAQPLRIGDQVTIEDETGVVEDVRLNDTVLRTAQGRRLLIPNERLALEVLQNHTILDDRVRPEASIWLPRTADTDVATACLAGIEQELDVRIEEIASDRVRIAVIAEPVPAPQRAAREADLRPAALRALRGARLLA